MRTQAKEFAGLAKALTVWQREQGGLGESAGCRRSGGVGSLLVIGMLGLAVLLGPGGVAGAANPPIAVHSNVEKGVLEVQYKGQKVLVYAFATNQFKPYVRELCTLRGENVLRDAPPDHLHHHGMMYAVYVNGVNFWEERGEPGVQKHIELPLHSARVAANGTPTASFTEIIHWLAHSNRTAADSLGAALLLEQRIITVAIDETNREVSLRWESRFQVGPNAGKVTIHGPNYDGLGLRLPESFNKAAKFQNSAGAAYTGNNTQNVLPARWTSVAGTMAGREVMLAMFGSPDNARGDGFFFSMLEPFAYLSATQGLDKKPLDYSAGDEFSLNYLLTVYSEHKSAEFIQERCERWDKARK